MGNGRGDGSLWRRLFGGVKWNIVEAVTVAAGNLAATVIVARLLGLDDFGAYSIIRSTVYMMASVAGLGFGITATKYVAELRNTNSTRLENILGLCAAIVAGTAACFAAVLLMFAPQIAAYSLNAPQITEQLRIAAFYIFFVTANGFQVGILVGFEAFSFLAKINLVQVFASLATAFLLTWFLGLTGAALALGASALISFVCHNLAVRRELARYKIRIRFTGLWQEKDVLSGFTIPAALASVYGAVAVWCGNAILVRQADGLAQMALFTAAYNIRSLILFVPELMNRVATPILCNLVGENDKGNFSRLFLFDLAASAASATVVALALVATAPYFLSLFGKDFLTGSAIVPAMAAMSVIEVVSNVLYQPLYSHGKLWWQLRVVICWSVAYLGMTYGLAEGYGALGLVYGYLAGHVVSAAMYTYVYYQIERSVAGKKPAGTGDAHG